MREGRPVLDDDDTPAFDGWAVEREVRAGRQHLGLGVELLDAPNDGLDRGRLRGVDLVDDDDVGHAQVGLARVIATLVAGAERVRDDDMEVRAEEGQVVVAPVPDDDVGLLLGRPQDGLVVHASEDDAPSVDVGLVFLALLDGRALARAGHRALANRWTRCATRSP